MTHTAKHTPTGEVMAHFNLSDEEWDGLPSFMQQKLSTVYCRHAAAPAMYADLCAVRDYLFELYDEGNAKAGEYAASLGITIEEAEGQHHE